MNSGFGKATAALAAVFLSFASPVNAGVVAGVCGDEFCESAIEEDCTTCPEDCGTCPTLTTTTTLGEPPTTTTFPETTTTSLPPDTTTTTVLDTTTTTLEVEVEGACCYGSNCSNLTESGCAEFLGSWQGIRTSCEDDGICVDCGNSCVNFNETCDDGNTTGGDGCNEKCAEEACFECSELPIGCSGAGLSVCAVAELEAARNVIGPICEGPSTCVAVAGEGCSICGDNEVGVGEDCEDGNTVGGDCCSANCTFEAPGSPCPDGEFCNGAETCDGEGECLAAQSGADCSAFDSACAVGVCDGELDACVADTEAKDGDPCEDEGSCTVAGSGTCTDGECVGEGTTLSPSCRWIIVGGTSEVPVKVRNGKGSTMDANACGDTARSAGITNASLVVTADAADGEGIRFYGPPEVAGDIVTGGASVGANLYVVVPGTQQKTVAALTTVMKVPSGVVDTTGDHPLVDVCADDKAELTSAATTLDGMNPPTQALGTASGFKVPAGASRTIEVLDPSGGEIVEMSSLKVAHGATLTLKGDPGDFMMIRVTSGRMTIGYGAKVTLDGLLPENVLFYSQGSRCRLSPGVVGGGTVFCPKAAKFVVGVGTTWSGTFLGGMREIQVRLGAKLTHVPFIGF
ncbi:MAG: hypothetical protein ABR587_00400 [Candidatus Binatia bacterium]